MSLLLSSATSGSIFFQKEKKRKENKALILLEHRHVATFLRFVAGRCDMRRLGSPNFATAQRVLENDEDQTSNAPRAIRRWRRIRR